MYGGDGLRQSVGLMQVLVLGSAAGGGFPQWNCNCAGCQAVRSGKEGVLGRTQSSLAIRGSSGGWFLVNASPDVRQQLERLRDNSSVSVRFSPIAGVLLTDAEIDHTAGLTILREASQPLQIYGTNTVKQALTQGFPLLEVLKNYCGVQWNPLEPGTMVNLDSEAKSSLEIEPFALKGTPPKYMGFTTEANSVVGFTFRDRTSAKVVTYAPALAEFTPEIVKRFEASDCILVDGTFWQDDELVRLGTSTRTALAMGHLPLAGDEGSLARLAQLSCSRKIFVHINNTNPILIPNSPERQMVEAAGIEVGYDGLAIRL